MPGTPPEEVAKFTIPIKPLVRLGMTPDRVIELIQLLQAQLNSFIKTVQT